MLPDLEGGYQDSEDDRTKQRLKDGQSSHPLPSLGSDRPRFITQFQRIQAAVIRYTS